MLGQTPLHLAVERPACLRLLLQSPGKTLLDQSEFGGYPPLDYAALSCTDLCKASVITLLKFDCRVPNQFSRRFSWLCQTCRAALFKNIKNQRQRLRKFALKRLPDAEAVSLGLRRSAVLDSKANLVIQALEKRGLEIPSALRLDACPSNSLRCRYNTFYKEYDLYQPVSLFHQNPLNPPFGSDFEALFQLGFRDFEEPASIELSPLLSCLDWPVYVPIAEYDSWEDNRIEACIWLFNHGANLWDPISGSSPSTAAHYLYDSLNLLERDKAVTESARLGAQFLTRTLSTHDVRDNCHCRCSPGGCSPFVWFLRSHSVLNSPWSGYSDRRKYVIDKFLPFLHR